MVPTPSAILSLCILQDLFVPLNYILILYIRICGCMLLYSAPSKKG